MIIFTEHSEVVMSVGEMREIIRRSFLSGAASRNATMPATFVAETWLRVLEKALREGKGINCSAKRGGTDDL